jgi:hypothetical protein
MYIYGLFLVYFPPTEQPHVFFFAGGRNLPDLLAYIRTLGFIAYINVAGFVFTLPYLRSIGVEFALQAVPGNRDKHEQACADTPSFQDLNL